MKFKERTFVSAVALSVTTNAALMSSTVQARGSGVLFDHLVDPHEQRRRHSETESLGRFEVDD
jgi:hypothetical protein